MMKKLSFLLTLLLVVVLASCRGADGDPGPVGPQGPQGFPGNANVYAFNYQANPQDFFSIGSFGNEGYGWSTQLNVPEVTQAVMNFGLVMLYYRTNESSPWIAMPDVYPYTGFSRHLQYYVQLGGVNIELIDSNFLTPAPNVTHWFKVVIAEGYSGKTNLDWRNYEAVKAHFNLAD
jgi:hypothetical protein